MTLEIRKKGYKKNYYMKEVKNKFGFCEFNGIDLLKPMNDYTNEELKIVHHFWIWKLDNRRLSLESTSIIIGNIKLIEIFMQERKLSFDKFKNGELEALQ